MWKILFGLVLIGHGIGHLTGAGAAFGLKMGFADRPMILTAGVSHTGPVGKVWALFWLAALVLLVAAGVGLIAGQSWWPAVAVAGAAASLLAIVPWWNTVVPGARAGAVVDVVILVALLGPWRESVVQWLQ